MPLTVRIAGAVAIVVLWSVTAEADEVYTCTVMEALWMRDGIIRPNAFDTEQHKSRRIVIDKKTGEVSNSGKMFPEVANWKRVHPASDDDTFKTRGYAYNSNTVWDLFIVDLSVVGTSRALATWPKTFVAIAHPETEFFSGICK